MLRPLYGRVFLDTLLLCLLTSAISLLLGYPLAYALVRARSAIVKSIILIIVVTPLFLGEVVRTYSWIVVLGNSGFVNSVLLKLGVMDFGAMDISKMAGDDPRFEACDLAGLTLDPDKARAACNAYRAVIDRQMQKNWNVKLLAFGGNTPQVFWCKDVATGLAGFKGKKVRVFNNTMRDFLAGVGATAVSMAFAEVVPALSAGVVDCGVTGSLSGNTAGWAEVTKSIYPMSLGWSINVLAVNLDSWKRLDPKTQAFLLEQFKAYEDKMWTTVRTTTAEADNCNTGQQPCTMGKLAKTTIVAVKPEEMETHKKLVEGAVLAGWAKRCGAECTKEWNETVGKALGLTAPTP